MSSQTSQVHPAKAAAQTSSRFRNPLSIRPKDLLERASVFLNTGKSRGPLARLKMGMLDPHFPKVLDTNPWLLGVRGGVLDLKTGQVRPGDPADLVSMRVDVAYNPEAQCPKFLKALESIYLTPNGDTDRDVIDYVQRLCGYCLTGDMIEQCFVIHYGPSAGNGKSVIGNILSSVLGPYAATLRPGVLLAGSPGGGSGTSPSSATPQLAALPKKRLAVVQESERGAHLVEAQLKRITGGDPISYRDLRKAETTFSPMCKLMLFTNHLPVVRLGDESLCRRLVVLTYRAKFVDSPDLSRSTFERQRVPNLERQLLSEEREGILAWMVQGCLAWQGKGAGGQVGKTDGHGKEAGGQGKEAGAQGREADGQGKEAGGQGGEAGLAVPESVTADTANLLWTGPDPDVMGLDTMGSGTMGPGTRHFATVQQRRHVASFLQEAVEPCESGGVPSASLFEHYTDWFSSKILPAHERAGNAGQLSKLISKVSQLQPLRKRVGSVWQLALLK